MSVNVPQKLLMVGLFSVTWHDVALLVCHVTTVRSPLRTFPGSTEIWPVTCITGGVKTHCPPEQDQLMPRCKQSSKPPAQPFMTLFAFAPVPQTSGSVHCGALASHKLLPGLNVKPTGQPVKTQPPRIDKVKLIPHPPLPPPSPPPPPPSMPLHGPMVCIPGSFGQTSVSPPVPQGPLVWMPGSLGQTSVGGGGGGAVTHCPFTSV